MTLRIAEPWSGVLVGLLAVFLVAALRTMFDAAGAAAATPAPAAPGRVLIVADEWEPMEELAKFLRDPGRYTVQSVEQKLLPADLGQYAAVFMYLHGKMTHPTERALVEYAAAGGRLVILHHGIASARVANPAWLAMTGIHIAPPSDPEAPWRVIHNITHTLVNLNPRHYITTHNVTYERTVEYRSSDAPSRPAKLPATDLTDTEVFLNQQFTDGRAKTVLLGMHCVDPKTKQPIMQDRSGWYKPFGKGWVFYFQPGHAASDFRHRGYCQMIWNCLTWRPDMGPTGD